MRSRTVAGAALAAAVVGLVVVLVAIFLPRTTDGSAAAPAPVLVQKNLTEAAGQFAAHPGAKYTGSVSSDRDKIKLDEVVVSSAGDLSGRIKVGGEAAEIIGVNGQTFAKGSAGFWKGQLEDTPKINYEAVATGWAQLDPAVFPDLGRLLAPPKLAGAVAGDDKLFDLTARGAANGLIGTPDVRYRPAGLPAVVAESDSVVLAGDSLRITTQDDGGISSVSGPLPAGGGNVFDVDLQVQKAGPNEVGRVYDTIGEQTAALTHVPAPYIRPDFAASGFRLSVSPCSPPVCEYIVTYVASTPAATGPGSATVVGNMTLTLNGRPVGGTCAHTVTVPLNGRAESRCPFTVPNEDGTLKGDVTYVFTTFLDQDRGAFENALSANKKAATVGAVGTWKPAGFKETRQARDHSRQVTGVPSTFVYEVNEYAFDGRAPDGTLLMTFGPGYADNISRDGLLGSDWEGTEVLLENADQQLEAAGSTPVRWVFAEPEAADAVGKTLQSQGVRGITTVAVQTG